MVEMDEKTAREMVDKIGEWLACGAPGAEPREYVYETLAADIARELSFSLLDAAKVKNMNGCPLCQL